MKKSVLCAVFLTVLLEIPVAYPAGAASGWKAGIASSVITPAEPSWMAGYGNRTKPSEGKIHDLHVKALALQDPEGTRIVIVTADLIGVTLDFSNAVSAEIGKRFGLPREAILFNTSHTHCGPEVREFKIPFYDISGEYADKIGRYVRWLETKYVETISAALNSMKPAEIDFSSARPTPFAVSRRFPTAEGIVYRSGPSSYYTGGPRDDTAPVLTVSDTAGGIKAILFGYACHPITLNLYRFCGDYPGFAQEYIEEAFPGATALFVQGTCGQLVPNARFQVEYAMGHGRALADAVKQAVEGARKPVTGALKCAYDEIPLDFQPIPERPVLEETARSNNAAQSRKAKLLLAKLDKGEPVEQSLTTPFHAMRIGNELLLIGLPGEPVAEYSENFKAAFLTYDFVWVAGYCNYMLGYLPTWKVWKEGGYEAGGAMLHTPYPGPFSENIEKLVTDGVHRLVQRVSVNR